MRVRWVWAFLDLPEEGFEESVEFWRAVTRTTVSPWRGDRGQFATLLPGAGRGLGQGAAGRRCGRHPPRPRRRRAARGRPRRCALSLGARRSSTRCPTTTGPSGGRVPLAGRFRLLPDVAGRRRRPCRGPGAGGAAEPCSTRSAWTSPATGMPPRSRSGRRSPGGRCGRGLAGVREPGCGRAAPGAVPAAAAGRKASGVRAHVDLACADSRAEYDRHVALGAGRVRPGRGWIVLRRPERPRVLLHRRAIPLTGLGRAD